MKKLAAAIAVVVCLALAGCGTSSTSAGNITGNWNATLTDTNGAQEFAFGTSLIATGAGALTVSTFQFTTNSPCFVSGEVATGTFTLSGDFNGNVSGQFGFTVHSGSPSGNTLTLTGTANGNTISGTWTLTGTGCTGNGRFTMTRM